MVLFYIAITLLTFVCMEAVTWLTHKYAMHGFMWYFHEDHHQPKYANTFERNDIFFVIGSIPSITLFYFGVDGGINYLFFMGLGFLLYGIAYFLVHDVLAHRRLAWWKKSNNTYLQAIVRAHKIHHKHMQKEDSESFGLLWVSKKYFTKRKY